MKKIIISIVSIVLVLCLCVSCNIVNDTKHTTHVDDNKDGICDVCKENLKLAAPTVTVDENGLATWNQVENAESYIYKLNGSEMATKKTSLQLADKDVLQVKVVAKAPYADSEYSEEVTYKKAVEVVYGLPQNEDGFYMRDADIIQDGNTRYLVYTTNKEKATEENVIAIRKGELQEGGWVYGEQTIILEASLEGWDMYLGSASLTKGVFELNGETYNYLLAYQGTQSSKNTANQIGIAVAKEIDGEYVKVGNAPIITFDAEVYGANMVGCYAPSVINYNKTSGIRIFYTLADAYGHYAYFADFDMSNLASIKGSKAMVTNAGALQGGDAVTMFPNADFMYDEKNQVFYAVKDVSPSPATKPAFADEFELCHIAEMELYTTDKGEGWVSDDYKDYIDLECDRVYSACIISDMYGHMLDGDIVIVYNICEIGNDYMYTQMLKEYTVAR